jgi:hypothetical protein
MKAGALWSFAVTGWGVALPEGLSQVGERMELKRYLCLLLEVVAVVAVWVEAGDQRRLPETDAFRATSQAMDRYRVRLGSVDLIPEGGLHAVEVDSGGSFLIQFHQEPTPAPPTAACRRC